MEILVWSLLKFWLVSEETLTTSVFEPEFVGLAFVDVTLLLHLSSSTISPSWAETLYGTYADGKVDPSFSFLLIVEHGKCDVWSSTPCNVFLLLGLFILHNALVESTTTMKKHNIPTKDKHPPAISSPIVDK